jgi:hypothetical protein
MRWWTPTRASLREFAVVVLGVLAALAAQAWWEHRNERKLERTYLHQLLADTRENESRLHDVIADDSVAGIATARALAAMEGRAPRPAADSMRTWIGRAGSSADFTALSGTYRALLTTGDVRLIQNDSLRASLISYATALEEEETRETQIRGVIFDLVPTFAREVPFLRQVFTGDMRVTDAQLTELLANEEAAVVMFTIQAANVNRLAAFRRIRARTLELRKLLEAEIE